MKVLEDAFQLRNKKINKIELLKQEEKVLDFFEIVPDFDLNLMRPGQNLYTLTADVVVSMKPILEDFKPVWQLLIDFDVIQFECSPSIHVEKYYTIQDIIRNFVKSSAIPKSTDFEWLFQQMQKWNNLPVGSIDYENKAQSFLLLDTYLAASK